MSRVVARMGQGVLGGGGGCGRARGRGRLVVLVPVMSVVLGRALPCNGKSTQDEQCQISDACNHELRSQAPTNPNPLPLLLSASSSIPQKNSILRLTVRDPTRLGAPLHPHLDLLVGRVGCDGQSAVIRRAPRKRERGRRRCEQDRHERGQPEVHLW